jgi:two-component system OmpR family sensor kinase
VTDRRRRLGIRGRVVASFLVLLVAAEAVSLLVLHQVGTTRIHEQADRDLDQAAADLRDRLDGLAVPVGSPGGPTVAEVLEQELGARPARDDQAYLAIVDGRPSVATTGAPLALAELDLVGVWAGLDATASGTASTDAGTMRWLAVPVLADGRPVGALVATEFLRRAEDDLSATVTTVAVVTLLVLAGASLLAWGAAGRALAPLHRLAGTARSIEDGTDLSRRIEVDRADEVGTLASSLNGMLDRLEGAFASQQRFLDDAGHELRTPITIVRGHLELLDDDPDRRAEDVALVLDELDRMDRLVRDLRLIARSGRPDFLDRADVDLAALVEGIGRRAEVLGRRSWRVIPPPPATVHVDGQRLTEAVLNLADNAVDATGDDEVVEIGGRLDGDDLVLWVRDEGDGLEPHELAHLFDRTPRSGPRRPGSTGLGLPIVAAIAEAHGGSVAVESQPGTGSTFTVRVPRAGSGS